MKESILIFISILLCFQIFAQREINEKIEVQGQKRISIDTEHASTTIKTWDNDYILLAGHVNINENLDNEAFEYNISHSDNTVRINTDLNEDKAEERTIVTDHDGKSVVYNSGEKVNCNSKSYKNVNYGVTTDINLVVYIPKNFEISVTGLYGSVKIVEPHKTTTVNNTYASVDIVCADDVLPNLDVTSTYAAVDISLPENASVDLNMDTDYGKMYSDFDFTLSGKSLDSGYGESLRTKLNGGGTKVKLTSGYANIYLRKK